MRNNGFEYKIERQRGFVLSESELNKYGEEGWEMCGCMQFRDSMYADGYKVLFYFKRKIIDD